MHLILFLAAALAFLVSGCAAPPAARYTGPTEAEIQAERLAVAAHAHAAEQTRLAEERAAARADSIAALRAASAARQTAITSASRGRAALGLEREVVVREAPSLGAPVVATLPAGSTVTVYSHDGRFWGVQWDQSGPARGAGSSSTGSHWGYIHADAAPRDENARVLVTTGRDVAAERERERVAAEARAREAAAAREASRASRATTPRASSGASGGRGGRGASPAPSVARQCTAIARTTGRRCQRTTTNASGRCWQH